MTIHWESLTPDRVRLCAPLWSDRRGYAPAEFHKALARLEQLLDQRRANGAVIFEDDCVRGFGVTVFVTRRVADQFVDAPHPQFGKRLLLDDDSNGHRAVLDRTEIGEGNATGGLQLVVVNTNFDDRARDVDSVIGSIIAAFQGVHRGYRVARVINEVIGDHAVSVADTSRSFESRARFSDVGGVRGLSSGLFTLTAQQAAAWRNPLLAMFVYSPPRIGFTDAEQRILREAVTGETDAAIARRLNVPVTAVKSRWSRLQERAFAALPEQFRTVATRARATGRGPQNRHLVLEYVRQHPSELTPYVLPRTFQPGGSDQVRRKAL